MFQYLVIINLHDSLVVEHIWAHNVRDCIDELCKQYPLHVLKLLKHIFIHFDEIEGIPERLFEFLKKDVLRASNDDVFRVINGLGNGLVITNLLHTIVLSNKYYCGDINFIKIRNHF